MKTKVYVINKYGLPMMPTSVGHAHRLIKKGAARIARRDVFTIQLIYDTKGYKQPITLGVDAGSAHIGLSASTEKEELFHGEAVMRSDVHERMTKRRERRRDRRNRKTRYRQKRFMNRRRPEGWLTPTATAKIRSHENVVRLISKLLPISYIIVETASFDTQKLKNPDIKGVQYQQGEMLGYENAKLYVKSRDNYTCRCCGSTEHLQVHHIRFRSEGGSDMPANLITLCDKCHKKVHEGKITVNDIKPPKPMADAALMSTIRWRLLDRLIEQYPNVTHTYGYLTNFKRHELDLPKTHANDAFCIAGNLEAEHLNEQCIIRLLPRHTRKLHDEQPHKGGIRRSQTSSHYIGKSLFTKYDLVDLDGVQCFISGKTGNSVYLKNISWEKVKECKTAVATKRVKFVGHRRGSMVISPIS